MMLHQDGSRHLWLPALGRQIDLIVTMDDATSEIYSGFFVEEEGTASSFRGLREAIARHGLFCTFYTDRGSHYFHTPKAGEPVDKSTLTQVGRALAQLGIRHIPAYSPEARGRSERLFGTLQDRLVKELAEAGVATISDGALCAFPPGFTNRDGTPLPLILRKSDGGYGYGTTDMAAIRHRVRDLKADRITYVVGSEQSVHFEMVFAVARQAGWLPEQVRAEHAAIGMVTGTDRKRFRSRTGESVKLADLIDEAISRAEKVIEDRYSEPRLRAQIAEAVGIGALKYADLSVARDSSYVLDFDRMLTLTGNTGPYLQYAAARCRRIFDKGELDPDEAIGPILLGEQAERALALRLLGFAAAVAETEETAEPHKLAAFLCDPASDFPPFYEQCPVLKADDPTTRGSRLALAALTLRVLVAGLGLLGIPVPDRM